MEEIKKLLQVIQATLIILTSTMIAFSYIIIWLLCSFYKHLNP